MNSWNQPNDNEPSVGTLHPYTRTTIVSAVSPADTAVQTVDLSANVPVGCTMVLLEVRATFNLTGAAWVAIVTTDGLGTFSNPLRSSGTSGEVGTGIAVGVIDSSRVLRWSVTNTSVDSVSIFIIGYWL